MPTAVRVASDIPRLDANQGGRRCDGSSPDRATHDRVLDHAHHGQAVRDRGTCDLSLHDRAQNGRGCDRTPCDHTENGARIGWGLHDHPLAMVYSPYQHFRNIYSPDVALDRGTLFSELDLPFEGYKGKRNGGCAR